MKKNNHSLAIAVIVIASPIMMKAQFSAPTQVEHKSPDLTTEYLRNVVLGERAYSGNPSAPSPDFTARQKLSAGKDNLKVSSDEFTRQAAAITSGWPGATAYQRAFLEGTVIAEVQIAQMSARDLAKHFGAQVTDYSLKSGYFDPSADMNQVKGLLTDTVGMLVAIEDSVPADKRESSFGKFMDGSVAEKIPVINIFAMHRKGNNSRDQGPIMIANNLVSNILRAVQREAQFLPGASKDLTVPASR